jgi:uncharacterized membrane protein
MSGDNTNPAVLRSRLSTWLVVSLACNLFLAGILVGAGLRIGIFGPSSGPPPRPPFYRMVEEAAGKVSPEGLKKLSDLANELETRFRGEMERTGELRAKVHAELGREPFEVAAFTRALDALNAEFGRGRSEANRRFAEVIASLSPQDRKALTTVRFP